MPDHAENPPRLLAVFAHPDDEQWGTAGALTLLADRGVEIYVLSATSGDKGEISDPALATPETLGEVREAELREACEILGFRPPILWRYGDGTLAQIDRDLLVARIVAEIRRLRPQIVLTFDANGGYGHLDHITVHHATLAACDLAASPTFDLSSGPPHAVAKIYATAYPRSGFDRMDADLRRLGLASIDFGSVQTVFGDELLTPDNVVTTAVSVDSVFERRWAAQKAHRTQFGPDSPFIAAGPEAARTWLRHDAFRRIYPAPAPGAVLPDEDDLWAGLPLPGSPS